MSIKFVIATVCMLILFLGCVSLPPHTTHKPPHKKPVVVKDQKRSAQIGLASYYNSKFHGKKTANGERYDENKLTAAHRSLKFGTMVKVTNLTNKRSVVVRINDRGPFVKGRIIDLSKKAARKIGIIKKGVVKVRIKPL